MRWFIVGVFAIILFSGVFFGGHRSFQDAGAFISERAAAFWYAKAITFTGLEQIAEEDIQALLPEQSSVLWWRMNSAAITASLQEHPLVSEVRLDECERWSWGCFQLDIVERKPELLALVGDQVWLVGDDGAFIVPVPAGQVPHVLSRIRGSDKRQPPLVKGLLHENPSPDKIKARLAYVTEALETIEQASGLTVEALELRSNGEMDVGFHGLRLTATFDAVENQSNRLSLEASRLKRVLDEFEGKSELIDKVDLAFEKLAVIRLHS